MFLFPTRISKRYFPLPEIFNFHFFTLTIFVACILSSSQIARKGLQKSEWIESVLVLLKINRSGGLCRRNIRPVALDKIVLQIFALIIFFLPSVKYVILISFILILCNDCKHIQQNCHGPCCDE